MVRYLLMAAASASVLILLAILVFITNNSLLALKSTDLLGFLTGNVWKPSEGLYGAGNIILGTLLVTLGSLVFAVPVGIGSAIFMAEVSNAKVRRILKPLVELFAGIPSVVYGFFGLMVLVPALAGLFPEQMPTGFAWLTGSILLGFMALPTIISVAEDALKAVPGTYREASLAVGATRWETTSKVIVPAAISGIASAVILGIGRAVGETMAVMMVTGNSALVPEPLWNVFSFVRTITATLALEMPEVVVGSTHYSALFLLGLVLMLIVLVINLCAKQVVRNVNRKMQGANGRSFLRRILGKKDAKRFKRGFSVIATLAVAYMVCSLFLDQAMALALSVVLASVLILVQMFLKRITRSSRQKLMHSATFLCAGLCVIVLSVLLGDIIIKAVPALSWNFLTGYPVDAGKSGGIYPAIVGTLEIIIGTAAIALPLGILSGTYLAEYSKGGRFAQVLEQAIDVLNGTPSIVFALFGVSAIVAILGLGVSLLSGCITLAFMILPVIIRTTEDAIGNVPLQVREASYALGANKWQTTFKIVLPAALGGIMTGAILGLGRAAGETAPVMFTAAVLMRYSVGFNLLEPVMVLPYHLYYLATEGSADPSMQYATALVLLAIVLAMFLVANVVREYSNKKNKW
ncbi:MAG: phosphate ABC transporter permease PstA [archaeon]|nr:phosphate ABC transporter permease PstA [archaeon]